MKGKMKPAFAKKGYMDGGMVGGYAARYVPPVATSARGAGRTPGAMKMADGGYVCGHAGNMTGKNMKKGGK